MRLIDADALKEMICNNVYPVQDAFNSQEYGMFWTGGIEKAIDESPTIEAEPVRHGKWIKQKYEDTKGSTVDGWKCSVCGEGVVWRSDDDINLEKFCYNCGAKMDLDEVNDDN